MTDLNYGILGGGTKGQEHLRNLMLLDGAHVAAIVEPDADMRRQCRSLAPGVDFLDGVEALCAFDDLDAIVVASPSHCHFDQLEVLLEMTDLPILVETPLITSIDQAEPVLEAISQHPAPLGVVVSSRYAPPITRLGHHINSGDAGLIQMLSGREHRHPPLRTAQNWNLSSADTGGTLVEYGGRWYDLMRWLLNSEVSRVFASAGQDIDRLAKQKPEGGSDMDDNAYVVLDFESGQRAMLEICLFAEGAPYEQEVSVVGTRAKMECKIPAPERFWPADRGDPPTPKIIFSPRDPKGPIETDIPIDPVLLDAGDHQGATYYQHLAFFNAITSNAPEEVTAEDGLKASVIGLAAQHSARIGQSVRITDKGFGFSVC